MNKVKMVKIMKYNNLGGQNEKLVRWNKINNNLDGQNVHSSFLHIIFLRVVIFWRPEILKILVKIKNGLQDWS